MPATSPYIGASLMLRLVQMHSYNTAQQALCLLILNRAPVFLCCLLDCLAGRIPYAEPGDLGSIFPTQQCRTWDTYQVQAVAVTEQRSPLSVVHARRLVSQGARDGDLLSRR